MDLYQNGDSIECNSATVNARKIIIQGPLEHPEIGTCMKYKCTRNGDAEIVKELNPKKKKVNEQSHLNSGDKLIAEHLYVLVDDMKRYKLDKKSGHTGTHSTQCFDTKEFTFASISKPLEHVMHALAKKENLLKG